MFRGKIYSDEIMRKYYEDFTLGLFIFLQGDKKMFLYKVVKFFCLKPLGVRNIYFTLINQLLIRLTSAKISH